MRIKVQEFIDAKDSDKLISGDNPNSVNNITSKDTTDQHVQKVSQNGISIGNRFRRSYLESTLPFNEDADRMAEQPEEFRKFLQERNAEETFEAYFVEVAEQDIKAELSEIAKAKALKMAEQLLNKKKPSVDVIDKTPLPSLDEIKSEHKLIMDKLDKIVAYLKENLSPQQKTVIVNHINSSING